MTDKQIIIDGVDVSGCEFYWKEKELCNNGNLTSDCQENKDCLYKRYMRKEQECEELKEQLERADEDIKMKCTRCAMTNQLDEQLDQLKEQIKYQNNFIESLLKATNNSEWLDKSILDDEAGEIIEKIELDYIQLDQLKQTVTEIKEITENGKRFAERYMITGEQKSNVLTYTNAILQKISECEVGDEK